MTAGELYEQIIDEEMKTFLRKRNGSKFKDVNLVMDEKERIADFKKLLGAPPYSRRQVIEAFFRSTFMAWKNYYVEEHNGRFMLDIHRQSGSTPTA